MYPLPPSDFGPIAPARESRPLSSLERQAKTSGGAWRWLRWGLAVAAVAGWLAAFAQARTGTAVHVAAARVLHPSGESQR
jgi:hypothetical protein